MSDPPPNAQTAEDMQAAVRRIIAKQAQRQQSKLIRTSSRTKKVQEHWPLDPAKMPDWWTPEKQAYHDQVMAAREAEYEAGQLRERERVARLMARVAEQEERVQARLRQRQQLEWRMAGAASTAMTADELQQAVTAGLSEDMVQHLFTASHQRRLLPEEYHWFVEYVQQTTRMLPFIPGHFLNTQELIYPRLPEEGQWQVALEHLDSASVFPQRLAALLEARADVYFPLLLAAVEVTPSLLAQMPWPVQFRLAMTWLVQSPPCLSGVTWHPFIAALLAAAKSRSPLAMKQVLDTFFDDIARQAYLMSGKLNYIPFIAPCRMGNACIHCEGRAWKPRDAYCASLRAGCELAPIGKAWIVADPALPPYQWSLLELLEFSGITPMQMYEVDGLRGNGEFQKLLGGWLNRINKIRSRLACRTCGTLMKPNKGYAKFLAAYPVTVFRCDSHPQPEVKITHCWVCEDVIDSRDSRFQDGSTTYNLCRNCGAGELNNSTIGRRCPFCGSGPMRLRRASRYSTAKVLSCPACHQSIRVTGTNGKHLAPEIAVKA